MKKREIPMREWRSFLAIFSRLHAGALVTMNVTAPGLPMHNEVVDQPLRGVSDNGDELVVHIGNGPTAPHLGHRIPNVRSLGLQQTAEGADAALDIASIDGTRTVVRFRSPMLPEMLDKNVE